jgi:AcrR family transcriptional regulator
VLDAAVACIAELGIARASSNEIARRAGMTWGVIQHHFGSRNELLLATVERNYRELESKLEATAVSGGSFLDRLQAIADLVWEYCRDPRYRVNVEILLELRRDSEASVLVDQRIPHIHEDGGSPWDDLFQEALGTPIDRTLTRILFGAARGFALARHMTTTTSDFTQERAVLVQLIESRCQSAVQ